MAFWDRWTNKHTANEPPSDPHLQAHIAELCDVLRRLIALLEADGEHHWRNWMATTRDQLQHNQAKGAQHLLDAYGGMGSFNDLIIGQRMTEEGLEWTEGAGEANDQLGALRTRAYTLAKEILGSSQTSPA
ncbi:MAG: hypothetical protein VX944_12440 [Myxococcota bacterium]|nr:hypothetical protein [Myxococcota bacterium]